MASVDKWTYEQLLLGFHLYCQLPFGKIHYRNPAIIELAQAIGRTPSAVAYKLANFASLDPAITKTGRKGLSKSSALDRQVWRDFHENWETLTERCGTWWEDHRRRTIEQMSSEPADPQPDYSDEGRVAQTVVRRRQAFFRQAVLSSYRERCCISGLEDPRLLVASHIIPWRVDVRQRLNPRNGLCLSALHDRAFDAGLITLSNDYRVLCSPQLKRRSGHFSQQTLLRFEGAPITLPDRFAPSAEFLAYHREQIFLADASGSARAKK